MELAARQLLKTATLVANLFKKDDRPGYYFLIYHSLSGQLGLELDLPPALFRRQLEYLATTRPVAAYEEALAALQAGRTPPEDTFVLTFDDGYESFYRCAFPLLQQLKLPAILFVTTGFVELGRPYPLMSQSTGHLPPLNWPMLEEMLASGLVTLGAHTHTHPSLPGHPPDKAVEELAAPLALCRERLGTEPRHFAYPRALWTPALEQLVARYYRSAVIGGGQKAVPGGFNPYRIPRLPIRRSDGWPFFKAKLNGRLAGEEAIYARLHRWRGR